MKQARLLRSTTFFVVLLLGFGVGPAFAEQGDPPYDAVASSAFEKILQLRSNQLETGVLPNMSSGDSALDALRRLQYSVSPYGTLDRLSALDGVIWLGEEATDELMATSLVGAFIDEFGDALGLFASQGTLELDKVLEDEDGNFHLFYSQVLEGVPVLSAMLRAHVSADGRLLQINGRLVPEWRLASTSGAAFSKDEVIELAAFNAIVDDAAKVIQANEIVYDPLFYGSDYVQPLSAWNLVVVGQMPGQENNYVLDAATGDLLTAYSSEASLDEYWKVFWADNYEWDNLAELELCESEVECVHVYTHDSEEVPPDWCVCNPGLGGCEQVCAEPSPNGWPNCCHWHGTSVFEFLGLDASWNYYSSIHGREGWDDAGTLAEGFSDWGPVGCGGAYWKAFGAGETRRGTIRTCNDCVDYDIVGHEFTHGVSQTDAGWLNGPMGLETKCAMEAVSDVFGEMVELYATGSNDWIIGNYACAIERNLCNPSGAWVADHFNDFVNSPELMAYHQGGLILGKAHCLMGRNPPGTQEEHFGVTTDSIGPYVSRRIWYYALHYGYFDTTTTLHDYRNGVIAAAYWQYGNGNELTQTSNAFDAVGLFTLEQDLETDEPSGYFYAEESPSLVRYPEYWDGERVVLFYLADELQGENQILEASKPTDATLWNVPSPVPGALSSDAPAAVRYDDQIFVFWKRLGTDRIYYSKMDEYGNYVGPYVVPLNGRGCRGDIPENTTFETPAPVVFEGKIYLLFSSTENPARIGYRKYDSVNGWESCSHLVVEGEHPSTAGPIDGKIYLVWPKEYEILPGVWHWRIATKRMDSGENWSVTEKVNFPGEHIYDPPHNELRDARVGAAAFRDRLHLSYTDNGGTVWYSACEDLPCGYNDWHINQSLPWYSSVTPGVVAYPVDTEYQRLHLVYPLSRGNPTLVEVTKRSK